MRAGELASALSAFSGALGDADAKTSSRLIKELADVLGKHPGASVAELARATATAKVRRNDGATARQVVSLLRSLNRFLTPLVRKDVSGSLEDLTQALHRLGDGPLTAFGNEYVASASAKKTKKGPATLDQTLVGAYLKRLEAALADADAFMAIYRELKDDPRVGKQEAVEIADRFMGPVPPSTSRPKALQRVLFRHRKLMGFETGSASIGGKAA